MCISNRHTSLCVLHLLLPLCSLLCLHSSFKSVLSSDKPLAGSHLQDRARGKHGAWEKAGWREGDGGKTEEEKGRSGEKQGSMAKKKKLKGKDRAWGEMGNIKRNGRGEFMLRPSTWAHLPVSSAWRLWITLCSCGCKLTLEISLLWQGEGWWSLSSGDLASVCKYRAKADGGKLASALEPYGAYAHGGVCKDPGHGVRAGDCRLLGLAQDARFRHWHRWGATVRLNFSCKGPRSREPDFVTRQQYLVLYF